MARVFLTLNLPARGLAAGTPVVASYNSQLLRLFKRFILEDWERRIESAANEVSAEVDRLEYEKLKATFDPSIPAGDSDE